MSNMINNRYIANLLIATMTLLGATACSTTSLVKGKEDGIKIERIDSKSATIGHAYLTRTDDKLLLRGEIKRRFTHRGSIPGHLHITLIDPQGKTIKEADIDYKRRNAKSSAATFNTELPVKLTTNSIVRITHFGAGTHQTIPEKNVWRDAHIKSPH